MGQVQVGLRLDSELLAAVDRVRGGTARNRWIAGLLADAVVAHDATRLVDVEEARRLKAERYLAGKGPSPEAVATVVAEVQKPRSVRRSLEPVREAPLPKIARRWWAE